MDKKKLSSKQVRKCLKCVRPIKGHPKPSGKLCELEPCMSRTEIKNLGRTLHEDILKNERIRMASSKHKEADKKRKAIKRQNETNLE